MAGFHDKTQSLVTPYSFFDIIEFTLYKSKFSLDLFSWQCLIKLYKNVKTKLGLMTRQGQRHDTPTEVCI